MSGPAPSDPAEAAFEALRGEVALLRRAVEALASAPEPVDHRPAIESMTSVVGELGDLVAELNERPKLSHDELLTFMAKIAEQVAREPKEALWRAQSSMVEVSGELARVAGVLVGRRVQGQRLWLVGASAAVSAVVVWVALAGPVARLAPARWGLAERMAAASLAMPMWQAGERLMLRADPERWRSRVDEATIARRNQSAIAHCASLAKSRQRRVQCQIYVEPEHSKLRVPVL